jgi:hypothetical protein
MGQKIGEYVVANALQPMCLLVRCAVRSSTSTRLVEVPFDWRSLRSRQTGSILNGRYIGLALIEAVVPDASMLIVIKSEHVGFAPHRQVVPFRYDSFAADQRPSWQIRSPAPSPRTRQPSSSACR